MTKQFEWPDISGVSKAYIAEYNNRIATETTTFGEVWDTLERQFRRFGIDMVDFQVGWYCLLSKMVGDHQHMFFCRCRGDAIAMLLKLRGMA